MTDTNPAKCIERVTPAAMFSSLPCGRNVTAKDPDGKLCGLHHGAKIRREQKDAEYVERLVNREETRQEIARIEQGFREHGIKATVVTAGKYPNLTMTGRVEISLEDLRTLIAGQRFDNHETEIPK